MEGKDANSGIKPIGEDDASTSQPKQSFKRRREDGTIMPIEYCRRRLENHSDNKIETGAQVYLGAVVQSVLLKLIQSAAKSCHEDSNGNKTISPKHILAALGRQKDLKELAVASKANASAPRTKSNGESHPMEVPTASAPAGKKMRTAKPKITAEIKARPRLALRALQTLRGACVVMDGCLSTKTVAGLSVVPALAAFLQPYKLPVVHVNITPDPVLARAALPSCRLAEHVYTTTMAFQRTAALRTGKVDGLTLLTHGPRWQMARAMMDRYKNTLSPQEWSVYAEFEANIRARSTVPKPSPASVSESQEQRILHVFFYADDALRETLNVPTDPAAAQSSHESLLHNLFMDIMLQELVAGPSEFMVVLPHTAADEEKLLVKLCEALKSGEHIAQVRVLTPSAVCAFVQKKANAIAAAYHSEEDIRGATAKLLEGSQWFTKPTVSKQPQASERLSVFVNFSLFAKQHSQLVRLMMCHLAEGHDLFLIVNDGVKN